MDWQLVKELLEVIELSRGRPDLAVVYQKASNELEAIMDTPVEIEEVEEEETEDTETEPEDKEAT